MKQTITIDTKQEYNHPSPQINMLNEADDRATFLMSDDYEIGTKVILMHSGNVKVIATKVSSVAIDLRVAKSYRLRQFRKYHVTSHQVVQAIIQGKEELYGELK